MGAVSGLPSVFATAQTFRRSVSVGLIDKVADLIMYHFTFLRGLAATTLGTKELVYDRRTSPPSSLLPYRKHAHIATIRDPIMWLVKKIWLAHLEAREFYTLHGLLFVASGLSGLLGVLWKQPLAFAISEGAFVLANLIALKFHITLYLSSTHPATKASASLGILSNTGYITSQAMLLLGFHPTLALLICCMALGAGGLQILFNLSRQMYYNTLN